MAYCKTIALPGGGFATLRLSGRRPAKCRWCHRESTKLCDFDVSPASQVTHRRSCDAPMCDEHAKYVGPNRDLCPAHAAAAGTQEALF